MVSQWLWLLPVALLVLIFLVMIVIDAYYTWRMKRDFLNRCVEIAREHQLDHSRYLYPED